MEAKTKFSVYRWEIIMPNGHSYNVNGSHLTSGTREVSIYKNKVAGDVVAVIPDNALVMRGEKVHDLNFDE